MMPLIPVSGSFCCALWSLLHFQYPHSCAPLSAMPTNVSGSHFRLNLTMQATQSKIHAQGVKYKEVQNRRESLFSCCCRSGSTADDASLIVLDSYFHSAVPSSFMWFHHLIRTSSLPVTFFTVQKSKAKQRTTNTKMRIKLEENHDP